MTRAVPGPTTSPPAGSLRPEGTLARPVVRRLSHLPVLDGLRGLAIASVVAYHYDQDHLDQRFLPGGFLGVDLFFVLSGFLITALLLQEAGDSGDLRLGRFWSRRVRRLLPAAWTMVLSVSAVLLALAQGDRRDVLVSGAASLGWVTNWLPLVPGSHPFELAHLWSLAVEEQFYLLWPLALLLCLRAGVRSVTLARATLGLLAVATLARTALALEGAGWRVEYLATPLHCDGLLLGALLAQAHVRGRLGPVAALGRHLRVPLLLLLAVELAGLSQFGRAAYVGGITLCVLACALLVAGLVDDDLPGPGRHRPAGRLPAVLRSRPLQWLGLRSYSLYLWALPVEYLLDRVDVLDRADPVGLLVLLVAAGLLAEGSYRLVEHRLRAPSTA